MDAVFVFESFDEITDISGLEVSIENIFLSTSSDEDFCLRWKRRSVGYRRNEGHLLVHVSLYDVEVERAGKFLSNYETVSSLILEDSVIVGMDMSCSSKFTGEEIILGVYDVITHENSRKFEGTVDLFNYYNLCKRMEFIAQREGKKIINLNTHCKEGESFPVAVSSSEYNLIKQIEEITRARSSRSRTVPILEVK